jgi:two-component system, cell cycle response regulator
MVDFLDTTQISLIPTAPTPRVLIVDDDPLMAEHLKQLVTHAGFEARTVGSGAAALAAMRKKFAAIVITDLHMPDMDGLTLCRTLRDELFDSYIYVVLLTAQDAEPDVLAGLEAGADDYLSKRSSSAQLIARLRTARRILTLEHSLRAVIQEKNQLATTDALTGASNRRYFSRQLTREINRTQRSRCPLSLLLLDIDHFKRINDRHGHGVGDEVLQEFARHIARCLPRKIDWYARLGGEEFTVVLPDTDLAGAAVVAERIRHQIADNHFATSGGAVAVTVSIGVSGIEALAVTPSVDALLESADRCLYRSKDSGRNRVTAAQPLPGASSN